MKISYKYSLKKKSLHKAFIFCIDYDKACKEKKNEKKLFVVCGGLDVDIVRMQYGE